MDYEILDYYLYNKALDIQNVHHALTLITWSCDHTSPSGHAVIRYELLILGSIVRYYFSIMILQDDNLILPIPIIIYFLTNFG